MSADNPDEKKNLVHYPSPPPEVNPPQPDDRPRGDALDLLLQQRAARSAIEMTVTPGVVDSQNGLDALVKLRELSWRQKEASPGFWAEQGLYGIGGGAGGYLLYRIGKWIAASYGAKGKS